MNIEKSVKVSCAMSGESQKEVAAGLGITTVWLRKMMRDNNPRYLSKLAAHFNINASEFIKRGES